MDKKQITIEEFKKLICEEYSITNTVDEVLELPAPKSKLKRFTRGLSQNITVFVQGREFPYMLDANTRNEYALKLADRLKRTRNLSLEELLVKLGEERGVALQETKCRICEGGGWYTWGKRVYFKDYYTEY